MKKIPEIITFRPSDLDRLFLLALAELNIPCSLSYQLHGIIAAGWHYCKPQSTADQLRLLKKAAGKDKRLLAEFKRIEEAEKRADRTGNVALLESLASSMPDLEPKLRAAIERMK